MSAVVVDTSSWISYLRGVPRPHLSAALADGRVLVPPIVVAELFSGRMEPKPRTALKDALRRLEICDCQFDHWLRVGELRRRMFASGFSLSTPDAHVAQCCLDHDAALLAEDKVFVLAAKHVPLRLITGQRDRN